MKKAVAVPYIIAIVLGIVVIGLIGYWLFFSGGILGTNASETRCNSDVLNFCNTMLSGQTATKDWKQTDSCKGVGKYASLSASDCRALGVNIPG
ncbi:MAG: hypothetical protein HYW23_03880 [Candidatus Aenigmarchaeota archaeon]|nr:hypothetical protein [Candidatus Aenigmarchaeota archaeon]